MPWFVVGSHTFTDWDWHILPEPCLQTSVFRITNSFTNLPDRGATICSVGPNNERYGFTRIYPSTAPVILDLPIPPQLVEAGFVTRYIAIKRHRYARMLEALTNWQVTVEYFESLN